MCKCRPVELPVEVHNSYTQCLIAAACVTTSQQCVNGMLLKLACWNTFKESCCQGHSEWKTKPFIVQSSTSVGIHVASTKGWRFCSHTPYHA